MDEYTELKLPTHCTGCRQPIDTAGDGVVLLAESMMPEEEWTGDPTRILGWHQGCATPWVLERHAQA